MDLSQGPSASADKGHHVDDLAAGGSQGAPLSRLDPVLGVRRPNRLWRQPRGVSGPGRGGFPGLPSSSKAPLLAGGPTKRLISPARRENLLTAAAFLSAIRPPPGSPFALSERLARRFHGPSPPLRLPVPGDNSLPLTRNAVARRR